MARAMLTSLIPTADGLLRHRRGRRRRGDGEIADRSATLPVSPVRPADGAAPG
jgi:hypothetical protein